MEAVFIPSAFVLGIGNILSTSVNVKFAVVINIRPIRIFPVQFIFKKNNGNRNKQ